MLLAQLLVDGVAKGAVYAALALALVVAHRSTGMINFAQGEFATLSTMLTVALASRGLGIWVALVISMAASFVIAALIQATLIRRVQDRPHLESITMMIALYVCATAIGQLTFGSTPRPLSALFPSGAVTIGDVRISNAVLGVLMLEAVAIVALSLFFNRTKLGLGFRAVATAPAASRFAGVPVHRMQMIGWGIAAALGAMAGVSLTNLGVYVEPTMMWSVLVYSLAALTIGGADSVLGAVIGGILIGVAESLTTSLVPGMHGGAGVLVSLVVILAVLLLRPQGLFGRGGVARA